MQCRRCGEATGGAAGNELRTTSISDLEQNGRKTCSMDVSTMAGSDGATAPLKGLRIFNLTRVLAGPTCVQMLADFGADVVKIEKPAIGDDTRGFVPPLMPGTSESAHFAGANRNKKSVTLDISRPEGEDIALRLIEQCGVSRRELQGRHIGSVRSGLYATACSLPTPDLLLCHWVWADGPLRRPASL